MPGEHPSHRHGMKTPANRLGTSLCDGQCRRHGATATLDRVPDERADVSIDEVVYPQATKSVRPFRIHRCRLIDRTGPGLKGSEDALDALARNVVPQNRAGEDERVKVHGVALRCLAHTYIRVE